MGHESGIEKIICCDRGDNDAAIIAAMNNNRNNQWDNPFAYLVWMALLGRNGYGFGGNEPNGCYGSCYNSQMAAFQTQMQDNHNSDLLNAGLQGNLGAIRELANNINYDFNALQGAICDVRSGIQQLSGQVGFSAERVINAVNLGDCNVIQALKDCCCSIQKELLGQSNLLQRGQDMINRSIERGFSSTAFQAQQDKCDIIRANENNTQRIIDTLNSHWKDEQALQIQDLKFQLSQERQNRLLLSRLSGGNCGCGNGCDNGTGF